MLFSSGNPNVPALKFACIEGSNNFGGGFPSSLLFLIVTNSSLKYHHEVKYCSLSVL